MHACNLNKNIGNKAEFSGRFKQFRGEILLSVVKSAIRNTDKITQYRKLSPGFATEPGLPQRQQIKKAGTFYKMPAYGVGKLPTSRRYNQLPLLRSSPGGFARSWPYRTYPYCVQRYNKIPFLQNLKQQIP